MSMSIRYRCDRCGKTGTRDEISEVKIFCGCQSAIFNYRLCDTCWEGVKQRILQFIGVTDSSKEWD